MILNISEMAPQRRPDVLYPKSPGVGASRYAPARESVAMDHFRKAMFPVTSATRATFFKETTPGFVETRNGVSHRYASVSRKSNKGDPLDF